MVVRVRVKGGKEFSGKLKKVEIKFPEILDKSSRDVAKAVEKEAKRNISSRFIQRSGRLRRSVRSRPLRRGKVTRWAVGPDLRVARYAAVQEAGKIISGWHFVRSPGMGKHGEGYSSPTGTIRVPGRDFMFDAFTKINTRAGKIVEKRLNKTLASLERRLLR